MSFDPNLPGHEAPILSAELRNQFNGLKELIDAVPAGPAGPPGPALVQRGEWNSGAAYNPGDVVICHGLLYVAQTWINGPDPEHESSWTLVSIVGPPGEVSQAALDNALLTQTARNVDAVMPLGGSFSPEGQVLADKINEILQALQHPV